MLRAAHPAGRAAAVALLGAALLAPAVAHGWSAGFQGEFARVGGEVSFKLKRADGARSVANWRWSGFELVCNEGSTTATGFFDRKALRVENRRFAGRAIYRQDGKEAGKAKVSGEFGDRYRIAEGVFRVTGVIPPGKFTGCESKLQEWSASREISQPR